VVAGELSSFRDPAAEIAADPIYLEEVLEVDAKLSLPIPDGYTALVYVFEGQGTIREQKVAAVKLVAFGKGDKIEV
jgi:redox-sensitive bicupin YhaK (pirin superfamily)